MDAALGWIGELARWLAAWVPRLVHVLAYQRAIKFVRDRTDEIGPGLHLYWPITTQVEAQAVCRQVLNLANQTLVTKDGRTVAASGVVVYAITDLHAFLVENFDAEQSLGDLGLAAVRLAVTSLDFAQLCAAPREGATEVGNLLTKHCQKLMADYGVTVEYARFSDFAPVTAVSLLGGGAAPQVKAKTPEESA